jgi:hypothetical protein
VLACVVGGEETGREGVRFGEESVDVAADLVQVVGVVGLDLGGGSAEDLDCVMNHIHRRCAAHRRSQQ